MYDYMIRLKQALATETAKEKEATPTETDEIGELTTHLPHNNDKKDSMETHAVCSFVRSLRPPSSTGGRIRLPDGGGR